MRRSERGSTGIAIAAGFGILVVVVGIAVGGWALGWWLKSYSVNRNAQIYQTGYGAQSADDQQLDNLMSQVSTIDVEIASPQTPASEQSALQSQKANVVTQACNEYQLITSPSATAQQFASINCGGN